MSTEEFLENSGKHATRRTIVRGAAWSVPVLAAAVSTPLAAASTNCDPESQSFTVPSSSSSAAGLHTWEVPQGVTSVEFQVYGAAGGTSRGRPGGAGALVAGSFAVTAGQILELVIGQGGTAVNSAESGGEGYGNGGASFMTSTPQYLSLAGGGGGGSAILLGGEPLVVAGGGGGSSASGWSDVPSPAGGGGAAGQDAPNRVAGTSVAGGGKASGAGGVVSGSYGGYTSGAAASGSHGANGVLHTGAGANPIYTENVLSGGGGGGYTGGGSGSVVFSRYSGSNPHRHVSAGGGGGTSHVAPSPLVVGEILPGRASAAEGIRVPGEIVLTWKPAAC